MPRKPPAKERWLESHADAVQATQMHDALEKAPTWDAGGILVSPQQRAEALTGTAELVADTWSLAHKQFKGIKDGQRRSGNRKPTAEWKSSNAPLIARLQKYIFPDLLTVPLTKQRITKIQNWLHVRDGHPRNYTDDALRKAIQRAARESRLK
jgi:hypothetical protein